MSPHHRVVVLPQCPLLPEEVMMVDPAILGAVLFVPLEPNVVPESALPLKFQEVAPVSVLKHQKVPCPMAASVLEMTTTNARKGDANWIPAVHCQFVSHLLGLVGIVMKTVIVSVVTVRAESVDFSQVVCPTNVVTLARMVMVTTMGEESLTQLCAVLLLAKKMENVIVAFVGLLRG